MYYIKRNYFLMFKDYFSWILMAGLCLTISSAMNGGVIFVFIFKLSNEN